METRTAPEFAIQRSDERAFFDFGWLKTHHNFSFADYYDPNNLKWSVLRVLNDDTVAPGKGFGTHPHRDMEIVTYVLQGELEHKDSMGHQGVVPAGGVQYMSAGTGVLHSEFNHSDTRDVHFVQMWVIPESYGGKPAYGQHTFDERERRNRWLVVASGEKAITAPVRLRQSATLRVAQLQNASLSYTFEAERAGFLFVAEGNVVANGERLAAGDAVRMRGLHDLAIEGSGEIVFWDLPQCDPATYGDD